MAKKKSSIEEIVEQWAKEQLKGIKLYPKTDFINPEIEKALKSEPSKSGGKGANYPDLKCLLSTPNGVIPVMMEVKGTAGSLVKLDTATNTPDNFTKKGEPNYANISKYAVNGAVHYANAIIRNTTFKDVLAIGINGYEDATGIIHYEVSVWYLSRQNLFIPKEVAQYSDLSFLKPKFKKALLDKIANIGLSDEEIEQQKSKLEDDIERKLKDLNQKMEDELQIVVNQRVQLVTGLIMAGLGVKEGDVYKVMPLQEEDLHGDTDEENNDGAIIMRKIKSYLKDKKLPTEKIDMIVKILSVVFQHSHLEEPKNGESNLRTLYRDIKADIIPFLTGELHNLDFTGRLFNVLNAWVDVPDGAENDVVLTPRFVTELMARLCQVNKDSYVWDFATGSAGFLISAMHLMIADAQDKIANEQEKMEKILHIKTEQLLGIEKLADIYLLAVLNMILMKDGSANIIHGNSLTEFNGKYEQGELKGKDFPANVFLLNPPYSAEGKGFIFVHRALSMMKHGGMASVLIQENAGSGNGLPYTKEILKNNTLVASIKMPIDLFIGKSSVQTAIYVFEVGTPHTADSIVKFIDFSEDGYSRMNRRHSSQSVNLRDTNNARERYAEVVKLVRYGKGVNEENLNFLSTSYFEDHISLEGNDWTFGQHKKRETKPSKDDFRKVVKDYLAWRVSDIITHEGGEGLGITDCHLSNEELAALNNTQKLSLAKPHQVGSLFKCSTGDVDLQKKDINGKGDYFINSGVQNFGIKGKTDRKAKVFSANTLTIDFFGNAYYRPFKYKMATHNHVFSLSGKAIKNENVGLYIATCLSYMNTIFSYSNMGTWSVIKDMSICLPVSADGQIDYDFMDNYINAIKKQFISNLLTVIGQQNSSVNHPQVDNPQRFHAIAGFKPKVSKKERYSKYLPVFTVRAVCGSFDDLHSIPDVEAEGWLDITSLGIKANNSMFVVEAIGKSMQPKIHDGDLCVFELYNPDNAGSREGCIVLTQCSGKDDDYDCSYTIKQYHSTKEYREDGSWNHSSIQLQSLNPEYQSIDVSPEDAQNLRTVGILKAVIHK